MATESACQRVLEKREVLERMRVLAVGGANVEHGYSLPGAFSSDAKYTVDPQPRLAGGSSVNHACRLLAMGVDVHAVLPLVKSDPLSHVIVDALDAAEAVGQSHYRRKDLALRAPELSTPYTTIIRHESARAVLNEFAPGLMTAYRSHVAEHLSRIHSTKRGPDLLLVGHIHADRKPATKEEVGFSGELTEGLLADPALAAARKYANFGSAQYRQGARRWGRVLREHVDVLQLDIAEARLFCADANLEDRSLSSILSWFRDRCTVVITLGRFGAVGQLAGSDAALSAWPYLIDPVVDSTGAGDAMGAGIVAAMALMDFTEESAGDGVRQDRFEASLAFGRACGAYACTTLGGSANCPSLDELAAFEQRARVHARDHGSGRIATDHDLHLIDEAFES